MALAAMGIGKYFMYKVLLEQSFDGNREQGLLRGKHEEKIHCRHGRQSVQSHEYKRWNRKAI